MKYIYILLLLLTNWQSQAAAFLTFPMTDVPEKDTTLKDFYYPTPDDEIIQTPIVFSLDISLSSSSISSLGGTLRHENTMFIFFTRHETYSSGVYTFETTNFSNQNFDSPWVLVLYDSKKDGIITTVNSWSVSSVPEPEPYVFALILCLMPLYFIVKKKFI